jgi:hypothetical protein
MGCLGIEPARLCRLAREFYFTSHPEILPAVLRQISQRQDRIRGSIEAGRMIHERAEYELVRQAIHAAALAGYDSQASCRAIAEPDAEQVEPDLMTDDRRAADRGRHARGLVHHLNRCDRWRRRALEVVIYKDLSSVSAVLADGHDQVVSGCNNIVHF